MSDSNIPETAQPKRPRLTAGRDSLTGQISCMTYEDRAAQDAFVKAFVADLAPEGALQVHLAQSLAQDAWRLNRARAAEENVFALNLDDYAARIQTEPAQLAAAFAQTRIFWHDLPNFVLMTLYEQRVHRAFHKNLVTFQEMKRARPAEKPKTFAMGAAGAASEEPFAAASGVATNSNISPAPAASDPIAIAAATAAPEISASPKTASTESTTSARIGFVQANAPEAHPVLHLINVESAALVAKEAAQPIKKAA